MELRVRDKQEIVRILNKIEFINNIALADENRINGSYISVEKAFKKLFVSGSFKEYCNSTKQELETGLVDVVPMLCTLDIQGLDFRTSDFMFYIDDKILKQNIYLKAIRTFGEEHQKIIVIEEMGELIQAISKSLRKKEHNMEEEIADVEIMLGQLKEMSDIDKNLIEEFREEKLRRLEGLVW